MNSSPDRDTTLQRHIESIEARAGEVVLAKAASIVVFLLDVDGVMTDGGLIQSDDGVEHKRFHAHDTLGLRMLQAAGVRCGIVSGRASPTLTNRAREIGIEIVHQACHDKLSALNAICEANGVEVDRVAFMGDDIVDLPPMRRVGLALSPTDAHPLAVANAHHVLSRGGGRAAVREACELILQAQGNLRDALAPYFA